MCLPKSPCVILLVAFLFAPSPPRGGVLAYELFSSLGHMEALIRLEQGCLSDVKEYLSREEARLRTIEEFVHSIKNKTLSAYSDVDSYLSHPTNQHNLISRYVKGWTSLPAMILRDSERENPLQKRNQYNSGLGDMMGAYHAFQRLQSAYQISVEALASGDLFGSRALQGLTSDDVMFVGTAAYTDDDFAMGYEWLTYLLTLDAATYTNFTRFDVMDYLAVCAAKIGKTHVATDLTVQMLKEAPGDERLLSNLDFYRYHPGEVGAATPRDDYYASREFKYYERVCREDVGPIKQEGLMCYVWTNHGNPGLLLRPLKMEEISKPSTRTPHLVRFYDFISDYEIDMIKRLAIPQLNRATVHNYITGKLEHASYRVSKSAWLSRTLHPALDAVVQRITDTTNLTLSTSEVLQIANYGMGGQYEPHHDYSTTNNYRPEQGNRIATMLIYMSNLVYGGSTAFLNPSVAVHPLKGSSVFWYNLLPSGEPDETTRHAACPVVNGIKWVANQWIRERGQEFIRKCDLDEYSRGSIL